jgi:hypothetical protein
MHKTKVAAFMQANTLASAGWEYDMTGSPDGNYHCLDSVGNNYVTCFKNTAKGAYFALYTLTYYNRNTSPASGAVYVPLWKTDYAGGSYYIGALNSYFCAMDHKSIPYDHIPNPNTSGSTEPPLLTPSKAYGASDSSYDGYNTSTYVGRSGTYFDSSVNYYGFAIKDENIVIFSGVDTSSTLKISIASKNGLSTLNESDTYKDFFANLQTSGSGDENKSRNFTYTLNLSACLNNDGKPYIAQWHFAPLSLYDGTLQTYPYQSVTIFDCTNTSTHLLSKGNVAIDLLAVNIQKSSGSLPYVFDSAAGGSYLISNVSESINYNNAFCRGKIGSSGTTNYNIYPIIYVGWDASNPDITSESSWPVYTDA